MAYGDIAGLAFTGRGHGAAGKTFEAWVKKYWEKKAAGEEQHSNCAGEAGLDRVRVRAESMRVVASGLSGPLALPDEVMQPNAWALGRDLCSSENVRRSGSVCLSRSKSATSLANLPGLDLECGRLAKRRTESNFSG